MFDKARKHKPKKQMRKLNWVKVPKNMAVGSSTLWHKSAKGDVDTTVVIDPVAVEELFSRQEVKKSAKGDEETKKKQPSVVREGVRVRECENEGVGEGGREGEREGVRVREWGREGGCESRERK